MVRKRSWRELPEAKRPKSPADYEATCPECGDRLHNLGREFKPPEQAQGKQWRTVEADSWKQRRELAMLIYWRRLSEPTSPDKLAK